jgi:hypothetical protein
VYAVCHREYQEGDPLSYCGIRDLWSVQREGIAGCAYSSAANKMATICHRHADMNEPVDVVVGVIWDLLSGDETMSLTTNFVYDRFYEFSRDGARLLLWNYRPEGICVRCRCFHPAWPRRLAMLCGR